MDQSVQETGEMPLSPSSVDGSKEASSSMPSSPVSSSPEPSGMALASFICALLAAGLNLLAVTALIGVPLAVVALVLGLFSYRAGYGRAGIVISLFALLIALIYAASLIATLVVDPAL